MRSPYTAKTVHGYPIQDIENICYSIYVSPFKTIFTFVTITIWFKLLKN
jgi:hypothetical protein